MSKQKQSSGMAIIVSGWWPGHMEWGEERGGGGIYWMFRPCNDILEL